ncbi:eukaryotic translation initiation factor 3subunit m [Lichtheimia corymbifera JMRC:FSU:9682]|uniref:Eukaryotic translation initiation factor 3 subunit M n=1 Tax=Lichtheimia corymbifera JMRC:FSU:9682 TaxID=1263082 RepID=A0A068RRW5_9FUNG|nr:eukaryotic translation initiation factor 3subunit m [Lichtheimia corymbifera JMRC:FSU:9682]
MSNGIFVQGSLESQILDLAYYISNLREEEGEEEAPYMQETKKLIAANNNDVYIQLAKDGSIFLTKSDREVEGAFNLLVVITLQAQDVNAAVKELIKTLTQTESTKTSLKQKILLNLYNALPSNSPLRYDAFLGLVDVTAHADELDSLYGQLDHIDAWVKQWGIDAQTERQLYNHVGEKLSQVGEDKLAFDFLLKTLATYNDDSASSTDLAKDAVIRAVSIENFFAFEDLLQYTAIQKIKGTKEYELLDVFLNGDLNTYKTFAAANADLMKRLDADSNVRKIRLLALASLGCENLTRELSYAEIAKSLDISEDEVEMWVIDVIRAGLVEAKLDQLNKTVIVHRSVHRVFGKEQWQQLSERLNTWKESLNEIMAVVGNAKLIAGGALQGGAAAVVVEDKTAQQAEVTVTNSSN